MQLTVFNGSPRGKNSNTSILLEHFINGFTKSSASLVEIRYLLLTGNAAKNVELFGHSENVIIAFPLYADAMPGIVKYFIEKLEPFCGKDGNPTLGFIVHSGFPEAKHSRYVEKYLEKLAYRLGCPYAGTIIKPSSEGIRMMQERRTRKVFSIFHELGKNFAKNKTFDPILLEKLVKMESLSGIGTIIVKLISWLGLINFYWNMQLKKNGVFKDRFAQPYK